jgi:hypothetical protein
MTKHIGLKTMNQGTALATGTLALPPLVIEGLEEFKGSFDRLCLQAGTAAIEAMLVADAEQLCGKRYERHADRRAYRWGLIGSEIGWHGGKAAVRRPRVRQRGGGEVQLSNWKAIQEADLLSRWAFNQMLIGVATRKYARSVRLPDGDLAGQARRATTKSSVSRRFVALSTTKLKEWLAADLSGLDLLVIQIDGLHVGDHVLVAAIGIDGAGDKHVLALALGATENCKDPTSGEWVRTFAIITTDANDLVGDIHDRMPLILARGDYARWLSDEPDPHDLMRPFPADPMRMWPISTRVNKPENDEPSILDPVSPVVA